MSDDDDSLSEYGCRTLAEEDGLRVGILYEVIGAYDGFEERVRNKLDRVIFRWCCRHAMTEEMFNGNEGRSKCGTMLKAFKSFKHRMYGFETKLDGIHTFIIVDYDPAKKRNKADPQILTRAKGRVDAFGKGN
jgi:hypothetical protein